MWRFGRRQVEVAVQTVVVVPVEPAEGGELDVLDGLPGPSLARRTADQLGLVVLRLFLWESLHYREKPLPNDEHRAARYRAKVQALAGILGTEVDTNTAGALLLMIGLAAWPLAVTPMTRLVLGTVGQTDASKVQDVASEAVRRAFPRGSRPGLEDQFTSTPAGGQTGPDGAV